MAENTIDLTGQDQGRPANVPGTSATATTAPAGAAEDLTQVQVAPLPASRSTRPVIVDPAADTTKVQPTGSQKQAPRPAAEVPTKADWEYEAPGSTLGIFSLVLGLAALLAFRRPSGISQSTFWAEDATELLGGWLNGAGGLLGPFETLLTPTNGQLWPLQRLLAGAVTLLPTSWWAVSIYALSCVLAATAIGVVLQRRAAVTFGGWGWRIGIAVALALIPAAWEVQGNLINLQYYLAGSLLVLLVVPKPRTGLGRGVELIWVALVAMSGPIGMVLAPLALWMMLPSKGTNGRAAGSAYVRIRAAVTLAFAALGGYVWFAQGRGITEPWGSLADFPQVVFQRVGGALGLGQEALAVDGGWLTGWPPMALAMTALVMFALGVLVLVDWRGPSPWWLLAGLGLLLTGLMAGAHGTLSGSESLLSASFGGRYAFLALIAAVLIAGRALATGETGQRVFAGVLAGLCVGAFLSDARIDPAGPAITGEQLSTFSECLATGATSEAPCTLPVAPEGWELKVTPQS